MYDAGVLVTVNSDDPPMFGTTLNREYEIAAELLDLDEQGIARLAKNAVHASFLPDAETSRPGSRDRRVRVWTGATKWPIWVLMHYWNRP